MPLRDLYDFVRSRQSLSADEHPFKLGQGLIEVFRETWHLGFTSFGGPPVHFQIFHQRFVQRREGVESWLDEQTVSFGA